MMRFAWCSLWLAFLLSGCSVEEDIRFGEGPVDLSRWIAIEYDYPANRQGSANWVLSADKQGVTQEVNADPSIFLSDRVLAQTSIAGTWLVESQSDDDFIGFVFAYQDPGRFYLFDWKGATQTDSDVGLAKQGMCVKVVTAPYKGAPAGELEASKPFDGNDLWQTEGVEGKVKLLYHEPTEGWTAGKPYRFQLDFRPGTFRIIVKDGERVIFDKTLHDDTYRSGRFGFYNFSQGGVVYKGFATTRLPPGQETGWRVTFWLVLVVVVIVIVVIIVVIIVVWVIWRRGERGGPPDSVTAKE